MKPPVQWKEDLHTGKQFPSYFSEERLILRIYIELKKLDPPHLKINEKMEIKLIHFSKEEIQSANKYMKKYLQNESYNVSEISSHSRKTGYRQKINQ